MMLTYSDCQDVDLVVLTTQYDQEALKRILVAADSRFYLVPSTNHKATYEVLWYRADLEFDPRVVYCGPEHRARSHCKVDVLVPGGDLDIPDVPERRIATRSGLPVMPLVPQLMLKLQAWAHHRASSREDMWAKQYVDVRDIESLLRLAVDASARKGDEDWLPPSAFTVAEARLSSFIRDGSPASASLWRELGFKVA